MITRHHSNARMSQVVEYPLSGTAVVTAGVVADDPDAGIEAQTRSVLDKIDPSRTRQRFWESLGAFHFSIGLF